MRAIKQINAGNWSLDRITSEFDQVAYLNSNDISSRSILALGCLDELVVHRGESEDPFAELSAFQRGQRDWLFGYLSYELKDFISDKLQSENEDDMQWPLMRFFRPEVILERNNGQTLAHYYPQKTNERRLEEIIALLNAPSPNSVMARCYFTPKVSREDYLKAVGAIRNEIQLGNIYELNYCIPFDAVAKNVNSFQLYEQLNRQTEAPFSVYYSDLQHALMCGSPERYLQLKGEKLKAQPIKGTARRSRGGEDAVLKEQLRNDPKERAENVMITDLVRNDLSRVAAADSVEVEELCGIYSFKTVHQMISTITARLRPDCDGIDALKATFPMGSMTGAPKISVMGLIEKFETRQRGLYSGAFGYFEPSGDFDFNVVIRSLLYEKSSGKLSFEVGSAITHLSVPEKEYEECLLKAEALLQATKDSKYVS